MSTAAPPPADPPNSPSSSRDDRDLFDDSTMSFGEHLEELRTHLVRSLLWIAAGTIVGLFFGGEIVDQVRKPLDEALRQYQLDAVPESVEKVKSRDIGDWILEQIGWAEPPAPAEQDPKAAEAMATMEVEVPASELARALKSLGVEVAEPDPQADAVPLKLRSPEIARLRAAADASARPVTLGVPEAFFTYVKVSLVFGVVVASPFVFREFWAFVAAGLYPHERKFTKHYGFLSLGLFLMGALFCWFLVVPFALKFLIGFNSMLGVAPNIQLSQWISFATLLPLMFGISFQLPIAMVFLNRIDVFEVNQYWENWRMAALVISVLSMLLTPSDPQTMILMMIPLMGLYFVGIWLCGITPSKNPFAESD